jgi:thioredoxin:protein disulfide reductase
MANLIRCYGIAKSLTRIAALGALIGLSLPATRALAADEFLEPEVAFKYAARALDRNTVEISFKIVDGYYLYRERFHFSAEPATVKLGAPQFPAGQVHEDEYFGKVETHRGNLKIRLPVDASALGAGGSVKLKTVYQGCADAGICYPPQERSSDITMFGTSAGGPNSGAGESIAALLAKPGQSMRAVASSLAEPKMDKPAALPSAPVSTPMAQAIAAPVVASPAAPASAPAADAKPAQAVSSGVTQDNASAKRPAAPDKEDSRFLAVLEGGNFWLILAVFLLGGMTLALTPCVLPMVPIISGIIVGEGAGLTRSRSFLLSLSYVLGMAITYTAAGIAAGLAGTLLSNALQNIWVLGAFALLFVVLAMSMFGFYELQLPTAWQSKLADVSNRFGGGKMGSTFFMGALSAVIVGPCVAAPLAGALAFIGKTHDAVLGGSALFALAIGMGVPLLLVGLSAGTLLPKAGAWMDSVKRFFGVMLLGLAIWIVGPVLPPVYSMLAVAALFIVCGIYLHALDPLPPHARGAHRFWKGVGVIALVMGVALLVGAMSGSRDILQPLSGLRVAATSSQQAAAAPRFERVKSVAELNQRIAAAGKPVMLDFYADWCVSCKEMEHYTFSDARVQAQFSGMLLLQADVTANDAEDKALLQRFGLYGPPGIIFFDARGRELGDARTVGYQPADNFVKTLAYVTAG